MLLFGVYRCRNLWMSAHAKSELYMKQPRATLLGMLAACVLPAAYLAIMFPLSGERDPLSVVGTFLVVFGFVVMALVILGVPMFIVLRKRDLVRWWTATSSGALVAVIALVAVRTSVHIEIEIAFRYAMLGGAAGLVFWLFWRKGAPENEGNSEPGV